MFPRLPAPRPFSQTATIQPERQDNHNRTTIGSPVPVRSYPAQDQDHARYVHPLQSQCIQRTEKAQTERSPIELVCADLECSPYVPEAAQQAIEYVVNAFGACFPQGRNKIRVDCAGSADKEGDEAYCAYTHLLADGRGAEIVVHSETADLLSPLDLDADGEDDFLWSAPNRGVGYYALAFTHEISLHALPDLEAAAKGDNDQSSSEADDHRLIYGPPDNSNRYLQAVRKVLACLPKDLSVRQEFLREYYLEVEAAIRALSSSTSNIPAMKVWLNRLAQVVHDPAHPFWTQERFAPNSFRAFAEYAQCQVSLQNLRQGEP